MVDIDHFKQINDKFGHDVGDDVLVWFVNQLNSFLPRENIFRLGGEEFAVVSVAIPGKAERISGESIRQCIESLKIPNRDSAISDYMTVSVGELAVESYDDHDTNGLMKLVDKRLYVAKNGGRNRVVSFDESDIPL